MPRVDPINGGRWGLMGGAFDPIHNGHLALAENALNVFNLDGVLFVPGYNPPHRQEKTRASFDDRVAMVRLAIEGETKYSLSDIEREIAGPGYTIILVDKLHQKYGTVTWYLILGEDNITIFDKWYRPEELIKKIKIIVGNRPGYSGLLRDSEWAEHMEYFNIPDIDISSTDIRAALTEKKPVRGKVPDTVLAYIEAKGLYR
jgi:nicotinate-nucleotide adenylyltransferase